MGVERYRKLEPEAPLGAVSFESDRRRADARQGSTSAMRLRLPPSHWTPRYVRDRVALMAWERAHRDAPWLTPDAIALIDQLLRPSDRVFEWGSGRSTRWFADRVGSITSIESNAAWHAQVESQLRDLPGARCIHVPCGAEGPASAREAYCGALDDLGAAPVDVVLVDGLVRDRCALSAVGALAPGGLLIIDDVERYLPSNSRAPNARGSFASPVWVEFEQRVRGWRRVWTTSGVSDTAIWFCPGPSTMGVDGDAR